MVPLAPFVSVISVLGPLAKDEIVFLMGVQDEIKLLWDRLERMQGVLDQAERSSDWASDRWQLQLTDAIYDSDDIVDECLIEGKKLARDLRRPPSASSSSSSLWSTSALVNFLYSSLSCFGNCMFRHEIGNRIASVTKRLDQIIKDVPALYLTQSSHERRAESSISPATSPLVEPDLVGHKIEEDTKSLVDLLVGEEKGQMRPRISVFAIVGLTGIGKTTLAQKIVNDERLQAEFDCIKPIWVYVSKVFSETDLLRAIIARSGGNPGDAKDKVDLEPMLNNVVKDKKLFLVLDDVWDARVWVDLLDKPLRSALAGSRVLVTTRKKDVAMGMDAVHCHQVERLSNEDGWSLLCKMVLNMETLEQQEALMDIGMSIVEKCDGLPLALKTTAGVLRTKEKRRSEWEKVLENPAWSMGPFFMSYDELPSHLKQCFVYFSLFPEYTELYQSDFIELWIAEGFVQAKEERLMEEVAEEYWKELIHRFHLQPVSKWYNMSGCKMHASLHTLAKTLSGKECFCNDMERINTDISSCFPTSVKPRRLHITSGKDEVMSDAIKEQRSLRTLMIRDISNYAEDTIKNLSCLRVLDIRRSSIERLPISIDKLIHLRYLSVSQSPIREIPESIGNLQVLQYFILKKCKNLHNLPNSITSLCNLRCIDLSRTRIHNIPAGIERLKLLTKLNGFVVSSSNDNESQQCQQQHQESSYCTLKDLSSLSQLKSLSVYNLEKTTSKTEASTVALKTKSRLTRLELHCTPPSSNSRSGRVRYEQEATERITEVFEELCPPKCLETLRIRGYFGLKYPSWMMNDLPSSLPSLTRLELEKCDLCERLPPLGLLHQFDYLVVRGASAVKNIGPELFMVEGSRADVGRGRVIPCLSCFPKLTNLAFENMPNWEERCWLSEEDHQMTVILPCLKLLEIKRCPKLRSLPEGLLRHATVLTVIRIEGARHLREIKNMRFVEELVLYDSPRLERVCDLPALKTLWLKGCGSLSEVENVDALRHLHLKDPEMGSLPKWLLTAGQEVKFRELQKLYITGKKTLLTRCLEDGLDWHMIQHVPSVEAHQHVPRGKAHTLDEVAYIYYTKSPRSFITNMPNDAANNDEGTN